MFGLAQDLRYAVRRLRQTPVFTAVVITTLALGLGVNTAVFSVADRAILRALPYRESDRLVKVWQNSRMNQIRLSLSYAQLRELASMPGQVEAAGADRRALLRLGLGEVLRIVAVGTGIGALAAVGATRALRVMLFGVTPSDPLTYIAVILLLALVALVACYLPIRRAAKADPMVTLRSE